MVINGIMDKIFKSMVFIVVGAASFIGMAAIIISFTTPEVLNPDLIIGLTYRFFPVFTVVLLVAVLTKKDVGIWH